LIQSPQAPQLHRGIAGLAQLLNRFGRARIRMQALPCSFDLFVDGIEAPVFEEFAAGTEALHLEDLAARQSLMTNPLYRKRFVKQWRSKLGHAFHRNLAMTTIIGCPDGSVVGKSFSEVAAGRGVEPVEALIDLAAVHGRDLRWRTVAANSDPAAIEWIVKHPVSMIGFSDAGAHLRNMAFHNIALILLKKVRDAERNGTPFMSTGEAVHKLTADIADFFRLDAGTLAPGRRGDAVVIDPTGLDASVDEHHEADMPGFDGIVRMVKRNDAAVRAVVVNGRLAWQGNALAPGFGTTPGFGEVLRRTA
jgi:N-acyl-D-aspartate/D-glutamate deacylase